MKTLKKITSIFLATLFVSSSIICSSAAIANESLFSFTRSINNSVNSGYVKLPLDKEIYPHLQNSVDDIRIFNKDSKEVPFFIYSPSDSTSTAESEAMIQNKGTSKEDIVLTLSLYNLPKQINNLRFDISSTDKITYLLKPEIKGSDDQANWVNINTSSYIYKLSSKTNESVYTIHTDLISFRYLNITFKQLAGKILPDDIKHVYYNYQKLNIEPSMKIEGAKIIDTIVEKELSYIIIDNGYNNAPVDKINFHIDGSDFNRQISIFGSNDQSQWNSISTPQEIYSVSIQKTLLPKTSVQINKSRYRYIKALFLNKDNAPLKITSVDVLYYPEYLVFNLISNHSYDAYFGSFGVLKGQYDTQKLQGILDIEKTPEITWANNATRNPLYTGKDKPLTERHNYYITIVIVLMVIILGWFIIKSLKNIKLKSASSSKDDKNI